MELKVGYKQTEVGVIPEEWAVDSLGCIGRVIRGSSPRPKGDKRFYGGNVPRLMVEDVTRDRKYVTPTIDFLTVEGAKLSRPCKQGTLTIVCSGTPTVVGLPAILAVDACIHDGMLGLVHLNPSVDPEYLFYRLTDLQEQLHAAATHGGTFVNLTTKGFGAFRIAVPPPPEQRAIATALSDVDELLGGLDRLIAKKCDLKQATMQQLLTGQTRLPGFRGEWEVKRLGDVASLSKGTQLHSSEADEGGKYAHLNGGITPSGLTHKSNTDGNSIAISEGGNSCGFVQFMTEPYWCGGHCYSVLPKGVDNHFLYQALKGQQSAIMGLRVGSGLPNVQKTSLLAFKIYFPPDFLEQTAIAKVLTDMDGELAVLEQRREKTYALKQAMMQELLTGRIRLIPPEPVHA